MLKAIWFCFCLFPRLHFVQENHSHIFLNAFVVFAFGTAALANCCCVFHLVLHRNGVCCPTRAVQVSGQHCAFFFAVHFFVFFGGGEGRYCALQPNPRLSFVPPLLTASLCLATLSLLLLLLLPPPPCQCASGHRRSGCQAVTVCSRPLT